MRPAKSNRILHCVLAILTVATLTTPVTAQPFGGHRLSTPPGATLSLLPPWARLPSLPTGDGPWVVRAYFTDRWMVAAVAAWTEPWEVNYTACYLLLEVDRAGYERLLDAGFRVTVEPKLTAQLTAPRERLPGQVNGIPGYPCYRTVEETFDTAAAIAAAHPDLATWIDIGDSWEKTQPGGPDGYDMLVLRLTNSAVPGPKPKLFVMTSIHAREYTPAELNTRFAEYLIDNYGADPDVTWLLDYHEIHLLLQANPDGRKHAEAGQWWRKNTDNDDGCNDPDSWGTDLNRNYEFQWGCCGGSSGAPCSTTYRGPAPSSEPETVAVRDYVRAIFPDQRGDDLTDPAPDDAMGVFLDIHSYSELVLWPWGFTNTLAANGPALQTLGRKFAYFNDYRPEQSVGLYPTDGTTDDFAYGDLGLAAYTFELGTAFFQDCATFEETILPDNLPALLYAAKVSRAPYLLPAGPDALDVTATPGGVTPGAPVQLTATLDDTRYNNENGTEPTQNIAAAEYYIDVPPWVTTTTPISYPLAAADGSFDEKVEPVVATVDTSSLPAGRHIIFIRGRDAAGNWGPVSATWLFILQPGLSPVIEGYTRQAVSGVPLTATVTAGMFQAQSDPATGYYSMTVVSGTYTLQAVAAGHAVSTVAQVEAQNYQTVRQDFSLMPLCEIFTDDVESGGTGWTAQSPWAVSSEAYHSPSHAWSDSPGGNYGNNLNISLTSPPLDLRGYDDVILSFWHTYDLEEDYDYGYVEYSTDGGTTWTTTATYNGTLSTWTPESIQIPALAGQPNARLRFRLDTDTSITRDGWHLDDIVVTGASTVCVTIPYSPTADFTTNSPVVLGSPLVFSNHSSGTPPVTYRWDFGDGLTSTATNPTHLYATAGDFTVTLTATNSVGSDAVSHTVTVQPVIRQVTLNPLTATATADLGDPTTYRLTVTNESNVTDRYALQAVGNLWTTTLAVTATGDLAPQESRALWVTVEVPLTAADGQTDTVTIVATSVASPAVAASACLTTTAEDICYPITITDLSGDSSVFVGETAHFTAAVTTDPHVPATYTWDFGDGSPPLVAGLAVTHPYAAPGDYRVTLNAANGCPSQDSRSVVVAVRPLPPETAWTHRIYLNGAATASGPIAVWPGDRVQVVDHVAVTYTGDITFTLDERWTDSLAFVSHTVVALPAGTTVLPGSAVTTGTDRLTWTVAGLPAAWEYLITRTYSVRPDDRPHDYLTTTLTVAGAVSQPSPRRQRFDHLHYGLTLDPTAAWQNGGAGTTVTYALTVRNSGTVSDRYTVATGGHRWTTTLSTATVGPLPPGASDGLMVYVRIPSGAPVGLSDTVALTVASQGDPALTAAARLTTTSVVPFYGLTLSPTTAQRSGVPGASVTYTLRLTNTGNIADRYAVAIAGHAWPMAVSADAVSLGMGVGGAVAVTVTIPITAAGLSDTGEIRVASLGDPSQAALARLTTVAIAPRTGYGVYLPLVIRNAPATVVLPSGGG